jgi:hypothetical protein
MAYALRTAARYGISGSDIQIFPLKLDSLLEENALIEDHLG